tara:strand:- start:23611 stop:24858 length:1248 start_codon:yes stop_codon:yes gene_type:complete
MNMRQSPASLAAILAAAIIAGPALPDEPANLSASDVPAPDVSIPTYPALALLSLDSSKLANVSDLRDLGVQVGGLMDAEGSLRSGIAFGGRPYWWVNQYLTLEDYRTETTWAERVAARTNFSLATVEAEGGTRLGLGLTTQLLDGQDPRFDTDNQNCINGALVDFAAAEFLVQQEIRRQVSAGMSVRFPGVTVFDPTGNPEHRAAHEEITAAVDRERDAIVRQVNAASQIERASTAYRRCGALMTARFARRDAWTVGIGATFQTSGQFSDLDQEQISAWSAYSHAFNRRGRNQQTENLGSASLLLRAYFQESVEAPGGGSQTDADSSEIALLIGTSETTDWHLELHASMIARRYDDPAFEDDDFTRYGLTFQYPLTDAIALEVSGGAISGSQMNDGDFLGFELKVDWSKLELLGR